MDVYGLVTVVFTAEEPPFSEDVLNTTLRSKLVESGVRMQFDWTTTPLTSVLDNGFIVNVHDLGVAREVIRNFLLEEQRVPLEDFEICYMLTSPSGRLPTPRYQNFKEEANR